MREAKTKKKEKNTYAIMFLQNPIKCLLIYSNRKGNALMLGRHFFAHQ